MVSKSGPQCLWGATVGMGLFLESLDSPFQRPALRAHSPHASVGTRGLRAHAGQNRAVSKGGPGALACGKLPPSASRSCCDGYPLYQLGNPQLRVFRTNFFVQLVRPGTAQPEDTVQFRIPMEMTRVDLRNYLERIYNVPVAAVRTRVQHGSNRKRDYRNVRVKKPDYKVAYVQLVSGLRAESQVLGVTYHDHDLAGGGRPWPLDGSSAIGKSSPGPADLFWAHGQTFTFPDLFPEKKQSPDGSPGDEDVQDKLLEEQQRRQSRDPRRGGVPDWFGL
ncbi:hypothetical protein PANDA_008880 [Ailuropoda melanoleuca]|uniref:Large ribosomal subunit protein uL23m n=1 Tax=Ailuropoda melanoleuca TaxID=9646 RepID=D2HDS7_AILME|nr:hypothetical protein PANDA_008880 [Ailuropoda melanoleuca]